MEEIEIKTIEWVAPEYWHKERTPDFVWTIGILTLVGLIAALWFANYLFAIFIAIGGASLILFTIRPPQDIEFKIDSEGIRIARENHPWSRIKGYTIKKGDPYNKLMIETSRYFLPIYTIPLPHALTEEVRVATSSVIPKIELQESHSMLFMEKLGL